jgi:hypothetical protein
MSWKIAALAAAAVVTSVIATDTPASAAGRVISNPGTIRGLNPQPLPPRTLSRFTNPWSARALNPQPLPPRWSSRGGVRFVR